jgi:hypothetical protein
MLSSSLNVFQRLARQWDVLHPYNAAQILKIQGTPNPQAIQDAWHDALNDLGLGRVRLDRNAYSYEILNGEASLYGVRVVKPGLSLDDFISEQLNKPFDNPSEPPFRPFILAENGFYYAGVVYSHWIADSVSIRIVLREWFVRLFDPTKARREPVRLPEGSYRRFFDLYRAGTAVGHGFLTATRWASSLRRARRVEPRQGHDLSVRWTHRATPPGWIDQLHAAAHSRGATLNDMFLAGIARVADAFVPLQIRRRRRGLALGSIVDLRPYTPGELDDVFGLYLGFTNVVCRPFDLRDPSRLLHSISVQSAQQKSKGIPQASALRMLAGVISGQMIHPDKQVHFYQKHIPLAGGISNVNMNRSWATVYHPSPLLDYIRVSPTGPMMPLVFATTTLGENFHFSLTFRPSIVPANQVDAMAQTFVNFLDQFCR